MLLANLRSGTLTINIRAFVALWLPPEHRQRLSDYLAECAAAAPDFRWVRPDGLHVTLRFLGGLEEGPLAAVRSGLAGVRDSPFEVELGDLGDFGGRRSARVVWSGLRLGGEEAARLATAVEAACRSAGLDPEARAFRPHVTLARARSRSGAPAPTLPELPQLGPWTAREMILFESRLGGGPAVYEPIQTYPLKD